MKLTNLTGFPAQLQMGSTGDAEMLGILACKISYALEDGWLIPVEDDEAWPIFSEPFEFEGATLAPDLEFRKVGVDLLVFGSAVAPGRRPVTQMDVSIECGAIRHRIRVFGNRTWKRSWRRLVPSVPDLFVEMPLGNERAFGGKVRVDGVDMGHPINPDGRGYYSTRKQADRQPLPNLEDPDHLIVAWTDYPRPSVLFKPMGWLGDHVTDADPSQTPRRLLESGFNQTIPPLIAENSDQLGSTIRLVGFSEDGPIDLPTPRVRGPVAEVSVGALTGRFPSELSTLVVLAPQRAVIATYLCLFRYLFRPEEDRSVELWWNEDSRVGPVRP